MKIECLREKLIDAIYKAEKVTGKNLTLPVLKCILLEAENGTLKIKATNLDLGLEIHIPVRVSSSGTVAVPGNVFSSFLQNLPPDKNIVLETVENNLKISTQHNSTIIKSLPHDDFATIPTVSKENSFIINSSDFLKGLRAVWYSSATSTMKPELSSIYIHHEEEYLVFAATDSFRLAEKRVKVKKIKDFGQILIPFKNVPEIVRIFEGINEEVEVMLDKNQIAFRHDGLYLTSRIIDGIFPDYKQIIPKEHKTEAIVLKQDIISSLKLANIFSDNLSQLSMKIDPAKKLFELSTKNADVGENVNKIDAALSGSEIEVNFNHKYISDCFQSIESDSVSFQFVAGNRPVVIRGVSDKSFVYLVMPMNK